MDRPKILKSGVTKGQKRAMKGKMRKQSKKNDNNTDDKQWTSYEDAKKEMAAEATGAGSIGKKGSKRKINMANGGGSAHVVGDGRVDDKEMKAAEKKAKVAEARADEEANKSVGCHHASLTHGRCTMKY
jgi:hypothetical protein